MERHFFTSEHHSFRKSVRDYLRQNVLPHYEKWEDEGQVPRELWREVGELGWCCPDASSKYGGLDLDSLYSLIVNEEISYAGVLGFFVSLHNDIVFPYLQKFASEEQKKEWIPQCVSGECILALAMTEPGFGSDVARLRTSAVRQGNEFVLSGSKTFISNGQLADLFIVAARTGSPQDLHRGISLFLVEAKRKGVVKGKKLKKIGLLAQDTSEIFFENVRVPAKNLLGVEGRGFYSMMENLPLERLCLAAGGVKAAEGALDITVDYVKTRTAFESPLSKFQNTRFKLAEMKSKVAIGQTFIDKLYEQVLAGKNISAEAAMAKYWITEMQFEVAHQCLQLFGGYGYMREYPISRFFTDARVQSIYGGTNEIMKEVIAREMNL